MQCPKNELKPTLVQLGRNAFAAGHDPSCRLLKFLPLDSKDRSAVETFLDFDDFKLLSIVLASARGTDPSPLAAQGVLIGMILHGARLRISNPCPTHSARLLQICSLQA
jgi:hypothetical protein